MIQVTPAAFKLIATDDAIKPAPDAVGMRRVDSHGTRPGTCRFSSPRR